MSPASRKSGARRMEKSIRVLAILVVSCLCVGSLAGCGTSHQTRDLEKEVTNLSAQVARLTQDKEKAEGDFEAAQERLEELQRKVTDLNGQIVRLTSDRQKAEDDLRTSQEALKKAQVELAGLRAQSADLSATQDGQRKPQVGGEPTAGTAAGVPTQPGPESETAPSMVPEASLDSEQGTPAPASGEAQNPAAESAESAVPPRGTSGDTIPQEVPLQAVRPTGIVLVVWSGDQPGGDTGILARRFAATGKALDTDPLLIPSTAGSQDSLSASMGEIGWLVVWHDYSAGEIRGARVTADGAVLDKQAILIASGESPSVVWGGVGWLVTYTIGSSSGRQLVCQVVGGSGKLLLDRPLAWGVTSRTQGSLLTVVAGESTLEHRLPQCLPGQTGYLLLASDYAKRPQSRWEAPSALAVAPSGECVAGGWETLGNPESEDGVWDIAGSFGATRWLVAWVTGNPPAGTTEYAAATVGSAEIGEPRVWGTSPAVRSIDAVASAGGTDEWLLVWTDEDQAIRGALVRSDCSLSEPAVLIAPPGEEGYRSRAAAVWNGTDYVVSCLEQDESIEQEPCRLMVVRVARNGTLRDTAAPAAAGCPTTTDPEATVLAIAGDSILPAPALTLALAAEVDGEAASAAGLYFAPLDPTIALELTADGKCRMLTLTESGEWASGGADLGHWTQTGDAVTLSFPSSPSGMESSGNVTQSGLVFIEDQGLASWGFFSVVWIREGVLPPLDIGYRWKRVGGDPGEVLLIAWQSYERTMRDPWSLRGDFLKSSGQWQRDAWVYRFEMPYSSSMTWDYVYLDGRLYRWDMYDMEVWECTDATTAAPGVAVSVPAETPPATGSLPAQVASSTAPGGTGVGDRAPGFAADSLSGGRVSLSDYRGSVVLLEFWASWCAPCKDSMPFLETLAQKYREKGLVVVGLSVDRNPDRARQYLADGGYANLVPLWESPTAAPTAVHTLYEVDGIPRIVVVDREGIIRFNGHPASLPPGLIESLLWDPAVVAVGVIPVERPATTALTTTTPLEDPCAGQNGSLDRQYAWRYRLLPNEVSTQIPAGLLCRSEHANVARDPDHPYSGFESCVSWGDDDGFLAQLAREINRGLEDYYAQATNTLHFVQGLMPYTLEAGDYWQLPLETLARKAGDCEDGAILYVALMQGLGYTDSVRLGVYPGHVFAWVEVTSGWKFSTDWAPNKCRYGDKWAVAQSSDGRLWAMAETTVDPSLLTLGYYGLGCGFIPKEHWDNGEVLMLAPGTGEPMDLVNVSGDRGLP